MQVWIAPGTGLANSFLEQLERLSQDSTAVMMAIFAVFALVHSGLAYLRPYGQKDSPAAFAPHVMNFRRSSRPSATCACCSAWGRPQPVLHAGEELMGARAYRVIFAAISLPLATLAVAHFINHRSAAASKPPPACLSWAQASLLLSGSRGFICACTA